MRLRLIPLLLVTLLFAACDPYSEHIIRGTLYADSTKTTPIAGDTLVFRESDYIEPTADSKYLGCAVTDAQGRWGFQYIRGFDNPYMQEPSGAKLSIREYFLLILHGDDTLYWEYLGGNDEGIEVWPGCWQHPEWWNPEPADTIVENPQKRGGLL